MSDASTQNSNDDAYRTVTGEGRSEIVVERSRFIGLARPVTSVDEATALVEDIRGEHYDARHVCFGLRVGRGAQRVDRSNDDGEPARTGGFPLWQLLDGEDVTDAILVVIRYYGGVKLGMGGLARAYREAGRAALDDAGIETRWPEVRFELAVPYELSGKIEHVVGQHDSVRIVETEYAADVTFLLAARTAHLDRVRSRLSGILECDPLEIAPGKP